MFILVSDIVKRIYTTASLHRVSLTAADALLRLGPLRNLGDTLTTLLSLPPHQQRSQPTKHSDDSESHTRTDSAGRSVRQLRPRRSLTSAAAAASLSQSIGGLVGGDTEVRGATAHGTPLGHSVDGPALHLTDKLAIGQASLILSKQGEGIQAGASPVLEQEPDLQIIVDVLREAGVVRLAEELKCHGRGVVGETEEVGARGGEVGQAEEGQERVVAACHEVELLLAGAGLDGRCHLGENAAGEGGAADRAQGLGGVVVHVELPLVGEEAGLVESGGVDLGGDTGVVDRGGVEEVEDAVGVLVADVALAHDGVEDRLELGVEAGGGVEQVLVRWSITVALGGRSPGRALLVALDPDGVRRSVVFAVDEDELVAVQGVFSAGAIGELLSRDASVDGIQWGVKTLEKDGGSLVEDSLIRCASPDLGFHNSV